ncbi:MAG: PilZ domain-containing protein [Gammaproteobacteria bacterium]|nr:PilZ domain-containing protein [Gammaproteobacteria bacterium]
MTMTTEYAEKRSYRRVSIECAIYYKMLDSSVVEEEMGHVANLSGRGLMFIAERGVPINAELEIRISPGNELTPPLRARVKVVRMEKQRRGGGYEIGAVIQQTYEE